MLRYLIKRLLLIPLAVFLVMALNAVIVHSVPGNTSDFVESMQEEEYTNCLGQTASAPNNNIQNNPLSTTKMLATMATQCKRYILMDMGRSDLHHQSVTKHIMRHLWPSLCLALGASLGVWMLGTLLGCLYTFRSSLSHRPATLYRYIKDGLWQILILICSTTSMILAVALSGVLSMYFGHMAAKESVYPQSAFLAWLNAWGLPLLSLIAAYLGRMMLLVQKLIQSEQRQGYILSSYAQGTPPIRQLWVHILPSISLTSFGLIFTLFTDIFLAGSLAVETIFSKPGIGMLLINAMHKRDYALLLGATYVLTLLVLLLNILRDFIYARLDPRIKLF